MEGGATARDLVIKVKYGDSVRRVCARVTGHSIDHDISILKSKIVNLFRFSPNADLLLQYTDVDGDLVTLETDEELSDTVINQSLNPLRVTVQLNHNSVTSLESSGTNPLSRISPELSSLQNQINVTVKEALKSAPKPVQNALSHLSQDFLSKAAASAPVISDIVNFFAKLGLSNLNPSQVSSNITSGSPSGDSSKQSNLNVGIVSSSPVAPVDLLLDVIPKDNSVTSTPKNLEQLENAKMFPTPRLETSGTDNPVLVPLGSSTDDCQVQTNKNGANPNNLPAASFPVPEFGWEGNFQMNMPPACRLGSNVMSTAMESNSEQSSAILDLGSNGTSLVDTQSIGSSLQTMAVDDSSCRYMPFRRPHMHLNNLSPAVHLYVTCSGCRMRPIVGPRYKSNVKHNYDLCSSCYSKMGNDKDYVHIDQATLPCRPSKSVGRCYPNPHAFRGSRGKSTKAKFESRFVLDVTIMDGTLVAPSTLFTKIWRMQNNGIVPWPRGTQLVWIGGDQLASRSFVELEMQVAENNFPVNTEVEIAVDCIAPSIPGRYTSYWRLATPSGQKFGQHVWVEIQVGPLAYAYGYQPEVDMNVFPQIEQGRPWMVGAPFESNNDNHIDFPGLGDGATQPALDRSQDYASAETAWLDDAPFHGKKLAQVVMTEAAQTNLYRTVGTESPSSTFETITLNSSYPAVDPSAASLTSQTVTVPPSSETVPSQWPARKPGPSPPISAAECIPLLSFTPEIVSTPSLAVTKTGSVLLTAPKIDLGKTILVPPASPRTGPVPPFLPEIAAAFPLPAPKSASMNLSPTPRTSPLSSYPSIDPVATSSKAPQSASASPSEPTCNNELELLLLEELEGMGFMEAQLNKEMLRKNKYDLEKTIDDLCDIAGWDPLLNDLRDMGFLDEELNKKLLLKNGGSIKHVVLDLINGETK